MLDYIKEVLAMFVAGAILLVLGAVGTTLGGVFMIGWIIKKITQ
jgi:energy-converting hydrogenase Eha subunit E